MRRLLKRWWFWLLLASPLMIVGGLLISLPKDPLKDKVSQIKRGMSRDEVVTILGGQPTRSLRWNPSDGYHEDCWSIGEAEIWVYFENGRVDGRDLTRPPTMTEKVRSWVRRYI
jgi:hypothetical protein